MYAGFQSTALMCVPRDKLHKLAEKGEMGGVGGARQGMMEPKWGFGFSLEGLRK